MRILYIHGFASSGKSNTPRLLRKYLQGDEVVSYDIPVSPREAAALLDQDVAENHYDLAIGTSLGGFYTMRLQGVKKMIINPAMGAEDDVRRLAGYGEQKFLSERADGVRTFVTDENFYRELKALKEEFYQERLNGQMVEESVGFFGTRDDVVGHMEDFKKIYGESRTYSVDMGHRIEESFLTDVFIPEIRKMK